MHENKENKLSLAFCLLGEIWRNALPRMPSSLRHQKKKKLSFKDLPNVSIAENEQKRFLFLLNVKLRCSVCKDELWPQDQGTG